ncbi:MAG: hypothetical protein V3R65_11080 [Acidiferrobacterales bacterium]
MEQNIRQYLRLKLDGAVFLLPSTASLAIEKREGLTSSVDSTLVAAWRETASGRWPAYSLDSLLQPTSGGSWTRAVYLNATPHPIGLVADEVQLISTDLLQIVPFHPPGKAPTALGHLFNGAHIEGDDVFLVLEPNALITYLGSLGV